MALDGAIAFTSALATALAALFTRALLVDFSTAAAFALLGVFASAGLPPARPAADFAFLSESAEDFAGLFIAFAMESTAN